MAENEVEMNKRVIAKIDELIEVANRFPKLPDFSKLFSFIDKVKLLSSDVHYITLSKPKVIRPMGIKAGDYVRVYVIPIKKSD